MTGYLRAWQRLSRPQLAMLIILAVAVVLANIRQPYPDIAPLQHIPTIILVLAAPILLARWPLSNKAVGALLIFWLLHTLGGRYTYSNVPYDAWVEALTGQGGILGAERNGYDRLVHFAFGLLWVPPLVEAMQRHAGMRRRGGLWTALLVIAAASALYEIFEWGLTMVIAPEMADEYNG